MSPYWSKAIPHGGGDRTATDRVTEVEHKVDIPETETVALIDCPPSPEVSTVIDDVPSPDIILPAVISHLNSGLAVGMTALSLALKTMDVPASAWGDDSTKTN
jgi:hypothetical protein